VFWLTLCGRAGEFPHLVSLRIALPSSSLLLPEPFDILIALLENRWLQLALTLASIVSALLAFRNHINRAYLRITLYESLDNKWALKMLLDRMAQKENEPRSKAKPEEVCSSCNGLVRMDNKPSVRVNDRGGDPLMTFHRECIETTEMRLPMLKGRTVKLAKLKNLWKLSGKEDVLRTDSPKIILAQQMIPEGVKYSVLIPTQIKIPPDSIVNQISKPDQGVENAVRQAYEKGPWGQEFYDKTIEDSESWKEKHVYFFEFMRLAEISIIGNKVFVFVAR
jgi:hypothetical protein